MTDLDLSFLGEPIAQQKSKQASNGLDISFVDYPKEDAGEIAAKIEEQRAKGGFPQGKPRGFVDAAVGVLKGDMNPFTGERQETNATRNLPELGSQLPIRDFLGPDAPGLAGGTAISGALLTSLSPVETVQMLNEASGGKVKVRADEAGNMIVSIDGREAILNKPGMSGNDWLQLGALGAAFTPAGRAATAPTILGNVLRVGAAGSGTQAVIEGYQASQGGSVDPEDVAIAGASMAGIQGAMQLVAQKVVPSLRRFVRENGITDNVRDQFRQAAKEAGYKVDDVTDDMIMMSLGAADDVAPGRNVAPGEAMAMAGEKEFKIPLTKGERTGDMPQLYREDRFRTDVTSPKTQRTMLDFDRQRLDAIDEARGAVQERLGPVDGSPGGVVREGVKEAERLGYQAYQESLENVGPAALSPEGMRGLLTSMKRVTRSLDFDKSLPKTSQVISEIDSFNKLINAFEGKGLKATDLKKIEFMRRRLGRHIEAADNTADKRQVVLLKNQFDDYLDDAVQNALFSGDENALAALKESRAIFRDYASKFRQQKVKGGSGTVVDNDQAGKFVERLIAADPTDTEVVNSIFGASGINKNAGKAMADRYMAILGQDSEGWRAIRQEAFRRMVKTNKVNSQDVISGTNTLKAIDDAMEKSPELMRTLFTDQEIAYIRRFAAQIKRTQPDIQKSRFNPSGSGVTILNSVKELVERIPILATVFGDPLTAAGASAVSGMTSSSKAASSVMAPRLPYRVFGELVAGGEATLQVAKK